MRPQPISSEILEAFLEELNSWSPNRLTAASLAGVWEADYIREFAAPSTHLTGFDRSTSVPGTTAVPEQESSVPAEPTLIVTRRTHETGTAVSQYRMPRSSAYPYRVVCHAHDTRYAVWTQPELRRAAAHPCRWCIHCHEGAPPREGYTGPTRTSRPRPSAPPITTPLGLLRKFGVELECINDNWPNGYIDGRGYVDGYGNLGRKIADMNLPVYPDETERLRAWSIKADGSVRGNNGSYDSGYEVVSPVLQGADGFNDLRKVMDMLNAEGFGINNTCGLHVHLDVGDLDHRQIAAFARTWLSNQDLINWLVHFRRRTDNYAEYCQPLTEAIVARAEACRSKRDIPYNVRAGRYYTVNLAAIGTYGTIEIRQHHGTLSYYEVESWIRFAIGLFDAICQKGEALPKTMGIRALLDALPVNDDAKTFLIGNALRNGAPMELLAA
jgi:hypothetical protein